MIHVLNYEENIIEDLSFKQDAIYEAEHNLNVQDMMETFDFTVASKIAGNLRDRNRIIIQDHMGIYREFIVETIIDLEDGTTEIQSNASYLNDITTAKPLKPKKFTKEMPTVILDYILADTGWEVADDSEVPGDFTIEWDKVIDRAEALKILQEETDMRLTYFIEVSGNKVNKRYVSIKKVDPLFNGEEIVYEDNLIGLKREIDFSEVATALLGVGPEESDGNSKEKERLYVEVVDDKAQEQFGLPQRYIWDYYEVPTESDEKVTKKLLEKRTRKELDERKKASVVYEVSSNAINAQVGDMIRVKDEHIVPEIYLEAEIIEINYDLLSKTKEYKFGILREFTRDQVYRQFNKFREELEKRLKDAVENTDSIISERLEEELKYVERYIEKSPTPPLNPKEGDLWLDTSHDGVAVLKRYENGEWIKSSVDDVKDIGGMTREETMYEALKERLTRNEVDYSEVFKRHGALVSEEHYHYVDEDTKNDLTNRYNALQQSYDDFKIAFNNINAEQPTIGLITTAISRAVEFEARLKEYNDSYYVARKSFDEMIGVLQSQYSEEKFNEAMEELAEQIGGEWDGNELVVDGKVHEKFYDVRNELERQDDLLKNTISETEYISDELSKSQSALEQHSSELKSKVSYTEMNGTNKTLEKLLTEFSQTADGFNFKIDSNGMIQDLTFDRNAFKLNSNLIEFNDGDVVIKDGVTTIKDAFIEKLKSTVITSEQVRIAYNNISNSIQITPSGLETTIEGSLASRLNSFGQHFYYKGDYIGAIGTGNLSDYPNIRGLSMTLDSYGEYLAFGYRSGNVDADDPAQVALLWSKGSGGYSRGFHFNEDIKIKHNKVIETLWLRPSNYNTVGERISFSSGQIGGVQGVSLRYNSPSGSGVHLSHNQVTVHANNSNKPGVGDLAVSFDGRGYYVRSYITYGRTYSYASNLYITSNGVIGRTTSARKYKLSIENQFKDDNKQLEHSKKILELDPKTWFDKSETEIYAEELKTGKKQTDDKFTLKRHFGMIADEFEEIGMKELVSYDDKGEVEGLAYDRIPVHHNVLIKDLYKENDELKKRIEKLEELING